MQAGKEPCCSGRTVLEMDAAKASALFHLSRSDPAPIEIKTLEPKMDRWQTKRERESNKILPMSSQSSRHFFPPGFSRNLGDQ